MKFFDRPTIFVFVISIISITLWALEESSFGIQSIAPIAGIVAIIFMSFDFISSTRLGFLEKFSGGLDILYRFHSYIGKLSALIILAHPVFLALQRFTGIETIQRYFLPGNIDFFNWGIYSFWLLLLLVILTVFVKMPYGLWKLTHLLMSLVYLFAAYHVFLDYTNIQRSPGITFREGWMLTIIVLGLIALVYKQFIYPFIAKNFKVVNVKSIGLVTEVYMEPENPPFNFIPGQYIFMSVMDNDKLPNESHPFGITSSINDKNIRVSIKALGDYTRNAGLMKPGNKVHIWGPHGMFNWESVEKYKKQIWIAGGIGIAPFLGMGKYAKETKSDKDITIFYVEKNESECEYNNELTELVKETNIKFFNHYDVNSGYLTAKAVKEKVGDLNEAVVMICGPKPMMKALKKQFLDIGLKAEQIKEEEFEMKS